MSFWINIWFVSFPFCTPDKYCIYFFNSAARAVTWWVFSILPIRSCIFNLRTVTFWEFIYFCIFNCSKCILNITILLVIHAWPHQERERKKREFCQKIRCRSGLPKMMRTYQQYGIIFYILFNFKILFFWECKPGVRGAYIWDLWTIW